MRPFVMWSAATALAVWGLSALAGHLPPRFRLLLLFSIGFGLLTGWIAAELARGCGLRASRWSAGAMFMLTVAGLVNQAWTAYRQVEAAARRIVAADSQQLLALQVLKSAIEDDPELRQRYLEERARLQPTFGDYLTERLTSVTRLRSPWPAVVWGLELCLGGAAAAWMFARPPTTTTAVRTSKADSRPTENPSKT